MWAVVAVFGVCGLVASANAVRFERRVAREVREMRGGTDAALLDRGAPGLPDPVRRYLNTALGSRQRAVRTVRFHHGGTFRTSLDGTWLAIRGEQHFTADPPGFIWWGRVHMFPGMWVDARDRSVNGIGNMLVKVESSFTVADSSGAEMDQGSLVRLLCEMPWFPTAFLDGRYVQWSPSTNTARRRHSGSTAARYQPRSSSGQMTCRRPVLRTDSSTAVVGPC